MELPVLNFPQYEFRFREIKNKTHIFDALRKKYVVLTPEEWVRQHLVQFLINEKGYPRGLIKVEATLKIYGKTRRSDVIVFDPEMKPRLVVECKAPHVPITEKTFYQAVTYNAVIKAQYLIVTNGLRHFCCQLDEDGSYRTFLDDIPPYAPA